MTGARFRPSREIRQQLEELLLVPRPTAHGSKFPLAVAAQNEALARHETELRAELMAAEDAEEGTARTVFFTPKLLPLISGLAALDRRADLGRLEQLLASSNVTIDVVREFVRYDAAHHTRNLVARGPWYEVLVMCWRSGQRSPIHSHSQSACALQVLAGVCSESTFALNPDGRVVALSTREMHAGDTSALEDDDMHQVGNLQPDAPLVTLHVYSPPLRKMKAFSTTGSPPSDWEPSVFELPVESTFGLPDQPASAPVDGE